MYHVPLQCKKSTWETLKCSDELLHLLCPFFCIKRNLNKLGTVENPEEVFLKAVGQLQASWRFFFLTPNQKAFAIAMHALCLSHCLSLSPLLKAIQPGLAGSQILSAFALCALDCTRLCRSCNGFAVPLFSPYALVYFRNRCNLHSNHTRGAGGCLRRGPGGGKERPCPLLPSSRRFLRQSPPPSRRLANRSPGIQRKLRSGRCSEEKLPCY